MPELYNFQKKAIAELNDDHPHIVIMGVGTGKTSVMMNWLKNTGKKHILIVTTASKRDSGDMEVEADMWCGEAWRASLSSFSVIGWAGLSKFVHALKSYKILADYAVAFDEAHCAKAGVQSLRGRAFLCITKYAGAWSGYTATAGDKWIDYQAYAVGTGLVPTLTAFRMEYCEIQTFKGYPEIVRYKNCKRLREWWDNISIRPDTSEMYKELPKQTHKVVKLPKPSRYEKIKKSRMTLSGELIESTMAMCHDLRQLCILDKHRQQWLKDYMENNPESTVFFTNYKEEAEMVEKIHRKIYPKARAWRIDGQHHDIPNADTIGKNDIVIANYRSGSEGLNLQFMNYCVFVSPNYSYSTSHQAKGRIARIGQKKPMFYYSLVAENSIEEDIMKCLAEKRDFTEELWGAKELTRKEK